MSTDIKVEDHGTVVTFTALTDDGKGWIERELDTQGWQWLGRTLCVDHRLAQDIVAGMQSDGLGVA